MNFVKMANVFKYFALLESLNLKEASDKSIFANNLCLLKKFTNKTTTQLLTEINDVLQLNINCEITQDEHEYIVHLLHALLLGILNNVNFESSDKTDLISIRHMNLCNEAVQHLSHLALWQQLHCSFWSNKGVFMRTTVTPTNGPLLQLSVEFYERVLRIKQFQVPDLIRDYMAAIYTLLQLQECHELKVDAVVVKQWEAHLDFIWTDICKVQYFRNTLLLKSNSQLSAYLQQLLHKNLLQKLKTKAGFASLISALPQNEEHIIEVIARLVSNPRHTQNFQSCLIKNIYEFLEQCILHAASLQNTPTEMSNGMRAAILSLRRFFDLNETNRVQIEQILAQRLEPLIQPKDVLSGLVLLEHQNFCLLIGTLFQLFCSSSVECLPSRLLLNYLPLFLQLHFHLPSKLTVQQQLGVLVTRCLDNCQDLKQCIQHLFTQAYPAHWQQLHKRVRLALDDTQTVITVKIAPASSSSETDFSISLVLTDILMSQSHNQLTYRIFMLLLKQFAQILQENSGALSYNANIGLLQTEEELQHFIKTHYSVKLEILYTLNQLVSHGPLRAQFTENSSEFLKFVQELLNMRLAQSNSNEELDQVLLMLLLVCQELLERAQILPENMAYVSTQSLEKLAQISANKLLKDCIALLVPLLRGEFDFKAAAAKTEFNTARHLIESHESYLQVQGLQMLLDLLRRQDKVTHLNKHVIIALALNTLRARESYTFLNCVRLFVALVYVMEAEVLEVLCDEYMQDQGDLDYRLVVGEALLKVSREIGPLCYKYKNVLLNCFMQGARSPVNEFRMSAFTNLAQLCNILCYQVQRFFNELLNLIDNELSFGQYLPAKRAAVLVLSELLEGMENLLDFQEMLLPLYRFLKAIEADINADAKMRTHAANGLKALNEKCYNMLFKEQELSKEIKIMNIKEKISTKNIFEVN